MTTKLEKLTAMKVEVALFHGTFEHDEYLITQILNDACYNSDRAVNMKLKWWHDKVAEADAFYAEADKADSDDARNTAGNNGDRVVNMLSRIEQRFQSELAELKLRNEADLAAYEQVVGTSWARSNSPNTTGKAVRKAFDKLKKMA